VFEKLPINIANEEFRLWQFLEDSSEERLHLHMEAFAIDDCPPYIALSYVWCASNARLLGYLKALIISGAHTMMQDLSPSTVADR
jgi:hypothetical protein